MHNDIQNNMGSSKQAPEVQLARAKALEKGQDWSGAIDAYLAITTQDTTDLDFLEGVSCPLLCPLKGLHRPVSAGFQGQTLKSCPRFY